MSNLSVTISSHFFDSISTILYLSRTFCLFPFKWEMIDGNYTIKKSRTYVVYSFIAVGAIVLASIYGIFQAYSIPSIYLIRLGTTAKRYVNVTDIIIVLSTALLGVVVTWSNTDKFIEYFYNLNQFDNLLGYKVTDLRKFKSVTISTMFYATALLTFHTALWVNMGSEDCSVYVIIISFIPFNFSYIFTVIEELMYWYLVYSVKIRVSALNEKMCLVGQIEQIHELLLETDMKKISKAVDTLHPEFFKSKLCKSSSVPQIRKVIKAYLHLVAAKNSVNDSYGLIILIVLLGCLIQLLVTPYLLRSVLFSRREEEIIIISQSVWMLGHILRLILIVEPCDGCLREIKKTSLIVCKMVSVDLETAVKQSLDSFLTCLLHCELDFTAFGLTTMHRGILTAIAGAVTTYLVILFQFN